MKIITRKKQIQTIKQLACIRHMATHLIFEDDRKFRIKCVEKIIEDVAHIAFNVCTETDATTGMSQLMYELQEMDNKNGTPMGFSASDGTETDCNEGG